MRIHLLLPLLLLLNGCGIWGFWRVDAMHPMVRSDIIDSPEKEQEILKKAHLSWSDDGRIRILISRGTPYERGYQQGKLLRKEVQENIGYIYKRALGKFRSQELFSEAYERMRPWIPAEHLEEMRGLAHGARMPLHVIHHIHVLADIGEWGGKKKLGKYVKAMMNDEFSTMCSNYSAFGSATPDSEMYTVRILDWGLHRISKLHEFPLIHLSIPEDGGIPNVNLTWIGYLGAISGMNAKKITLGEMGYRNPEGEHLNGIPMPFLLRDVMRYSGSLPEVSTRIRESKGTNSYLFLMSDGKTKDAEMYVKDWERFLAFKPGVYVEDQQEKLPAIKDVLYGGRYNDKMTLGLSSNRGKLTPQLFMEELIPNFAMESNFQNVIYLPEKLQLWVNNAASSIIPAHKVPYTFFDFGKTLNEYCATNPCPKY